MKLGVKLAFTNCFGKGGKFIKAEMPNFEKKKFKFIAGLRSEKCARRQAENQPRASSEEVSRMTED
jgi:hypothetical protein